MSRVESVEVRMRPDPGRDRADVEHAFDADLRSLNAADVELASQVWLQSPAPPRALGGSGESCIREEDQTAASFCLRVRKGVAGGPIDELTDSFVRAHLSV